MATFHAIAATSHALLRLLEDACPRTVFPAAQFDFLPLDENAKPISEGITLHLLRVAANTARRNSASRPQPDGKKYRPLLNLDLYYLLTPWASNADMQQRLLGWAMRTLEDTPLLPPGLLNAFGPEAETFHADEGVELVLDTLALPDLSIIWDQIRPKVGLSVSYIARMVPIESKVATVVAPDVQTRRFDITQAPRP
jgi:hypothetical protein